MGDIDKTVSTSQNDIEKEDVSTNKLRMMKDHVAEDSSNFEDEKHNELGERICEVGGTTLETQDDLINVNLSASEVDVMKDYVDEDSSNISSSAEDPFYQCDGKSDDSKGKLRRKRFTLASHITIIEDSSLVCYCCTVCKCYFSHKHTARNHEFCGSGEKPFKCKLCDKRFIKRSDRENHYKTHSGERSFICSICNKSFYLKHKLNRHIRSHTGASGDFKCSACFRSFINREALKKHQVNKHNPSKTIKCGNCGKSFERTEERQKHRCAYPPKKKKLVCEVCGKTFTKNWNLTVHLRIHVGQRPFKCSTCNKSFRLRQHLERHSTKHQADADFECMLCKQTFGRKDNMIRHLKLNHPDRHLGIDIKDMVQRSEKAKVAKSKKLSDERTLDEPEVSTEKIPTVLPVANLPNIRFAKMPSGCANGLTSPVKTSKRNVELLNPSTTQKLSLPGNKLLTAQVEKSVILRTVISSQTSGVLEKTVETRNFVHCMRAEQLENFKTVNRETNQSEPHPSVLVLNNFRAKHAEKELHAQHCEGSPSTLALDDSLGCGSDSGNPIEMKKSPSILHQQVSVLRFSSRDHNKPCQR